MSEDLMLKKAEELKKKGNDQLKKKDYDKAIDFYTQAIEIKPTAVFYSNRAQANIKKENFGLALNDANDAIKLNPQYLKGYYRRAVAYSGMIEYKNSLKDIKHVLSKAPNDKNAKKLEKNLEKMIRQIRFEQAIQVEEDRSILDQLDFANMLDEKNDSSNRLPELDIHITKEAKRQKVSVDMTFDYIEKMVELFKDGKTLPKNTHMLLFQLRPNCSEMRKHLLNSAFPEMRMQRKIVDPRLRKR